MPYFSFSLKQSFIESATIKNLFNYRFEHNVKYFSKNTHIWKILNNKNISNHLKSLKFEKRTSYLFNKNSVLFLMPPSIGLGDAVEYALSINSIRKKNLFTKIGIGFAEKYSYIFRNIFKFEDTYDYFISEAELEKFKTIFHFSKELIKLKNQKYNRADIEKEVCDFFKTSIIRPFKKDISKINKLTIFPIASSPIRTMNIDLIKSIVSKFSKKINIEIVLDNLYPTSKYLISKIHFNNVKYIYHNSIEELSNIVNTLEYGLFIDSGPLHLAKALNKNGIFIETSVTHKVLLNKFENFVIISNNFKSNYCEGPCGLTNLFNIKNVPGCFYTHQITKNDLKKIQNINALQRGRLKNDYDKFMKDPVGCIKNIDLNKILNTIEKKL
tara:strand:+ start:7295 stop:8446 length:1152 start_codon:yes stop_codon:yes gene_type:complete